MTAACSTTALATESSAFLGCACACVDAAGVDGSAAARSTGKASAMELSSCTLSMQVGVWTLRLET